MPPSLVCCRLRTQIILQDPPPPPVFVICHRRTPPSLRNNISPHIWGTADFADCGHRTPILLQNSLPCQCCAFNNTRKYPQLRWCSRPSATEVCCVCVARARACRTATVHTYSSRSDALGVRCNLGHHATLSVKVLRYTPRVFILLYLTTTAPLKPRLAQS